MTLPAFDTLQSARHTPPKELVTEAAGETIAWVLDQARVSVPPGATVAGLAPFATKVTVGAGGVAGLTTTVSEFGALVPPGPVHVKV